MTRLYFLLPLTFFACPKPPPPPIPPQPVSVCKADAKWVSVPQQPSEVNKDETFCDFHQFSWQWFLSQASPSIQDPTKRVFETQRAYIPKEKSQCQLEATEIRLHPRITKSDFEDAQADKNALYDQNGNILYYNIWYAPENCDATSKGFVQGTFEIKASWMILQEGTHHTYFTMESEVPGQEGEVTLGLVGFHMAIWTPRHPEMIWASWEHKQNAPYCDGSSDVQDYNLAAKTAAKCLAQTKSVDECPQYQFNIPRTHSGEPPHREAPNQVCRVSPYGNQKGDAINGNDNDANLLAIRELNAQLVGEAGILTKLSDKHPMKVWSNYEMVGGIWTKDGKGSGSPPVPHKGGKPDPTSPQRGSLELANTTMETFQQGDQSFVPNCFGCHNYNSTQPLEVSHIQNLLTPQQEK
jgi:hypothetical protein